jgi:hypothetical protein
MQMNTIFKARVGLTMAMFLTMALTIPAGAAARDKQTVLMGSIQGTEIDVLEGGLPPTGIDVTGTVTGIAPHLGRFTLLYKVTVVLPEGTATGSGQLIAANGDSIAFTIAGTSVALEPGIGSITEVDTITGGTGRFAGATGTITVTRLVDLATGITSGSMQGVVIAQVGEH